MPAPGSFGILNHCSPMGLCHGPESATIWEVSNPVYSKHAKRKNSNSKYKIGVREEILKCFLLSLRDWYFPLTLRKAKHAKPENRDQHWSEKELERNPKTPVGWAFPPWVNFPWCHPTPARVKRPCQSPLRRCKGAIHDSQRFLRALFQTRAPRPDSKLL